MIGKSLEVCLVGVGPRGLSVLERLCAYERKSPQWSHLTVHVVDPDPPGAGRVWRAAQSRHLLMNTVASQVTVYTDASVSIAGPLEEGPSLYQWAKSLKHSTLPSIAAMAYDAETLAEAEALGPDSYPTRVFYGHYLSWVFRHVTGNAVDHVEVRVHRSRAVALDGPGRAAGPDGPQTVLLEDGTRLTGLAAVVLAQGHVSVHPTSTESDFTHFAERHGLTYISPANPADVDLSSIKPGESVLLRGLGLNFFDYMALLTLGRGGSFDRVDGRLVYRPSGREPMMYAGSRRGIPYQSRGENEKGAFGRYFPKLLTVDHIADLRKRAATGEPIRFRVDLWPLIAKEVQSVYYAALLTARAEAGAGGAAGAGGTGAGPVEKPDIEKFTARYLDVAFGPEEQTLLDSLGIPEEQRWDWDMVARPYGTRALSDPAEFRSWLREYLARDVREARAGNVSGPLKAAFDVLRDLRNEIRLAVDHAGLEGGSHRDELEQWYTPLNAFLSIGPPVSRIEEMDALMEAGILDVTGPGLAVRAEAADGEGAFFVGTSGEVPGFRVRATALVEARLPEVDLRRTADPLMAHLLRTGQCRPYVVPGSCGLSADYETGGLAVSHRPYHVLDSRGVPHPRRFAYGVPTESVHWVTAAGIRPGVGSVTLEDSDAVAGAVLALPPLADQPEQLGAGEGGDPV